MNEREIRISERNDLYAGMIKRGWFFDTVTGRDYRVTPAVPAPDCGLSFTNLSRAEVDAETPVHIWAPNNLEDTFAWLSSLGYDVVDRRV